MKGYLIIDGKEYFGYDVVTDHGSTSYAMSLINKYNIACNSDFINEVNNKGLFLDNVPVPDGAKVHVLPGCPIPNDDIRKNYKIKRDFDSGDFNVFPEFSSYRRLYVTRLYISDTLKRIVISDSYNALSNLTCDYVVKTGHMWIDFTSNDAWEMLLEKRCSKPCVSYKKLSIKSGNQLTPDALFLLYRLGTQPRSRDNIEKFKLQLQAINQTNWRKYPNSVGKVILYASTYARCSNFVRGHKAERNKVTEQFFNIEPADYTDEDFKMLGDTIELILDIDGTKYVSFSDLNYKLVEKGISVGDMETFFGGIVQLKRRERKDA